MILKLCRGVELLCAAAAVALGVKGVSMWLDHIATLPHRVSPIFLGYLAEVALLTLIGFVFVAADRDAAAPVWSSALCVVVGALLALSILGAWSLGGAVLPIAGTLAAALLLGAGRARRAPLSRLGWCAAGLFGQTALMLGVIVVTQLLATASFEPIHVMPGGPS